VKTLGTGVKLIIWLPRSVSALAPLHFRVTVNSPNFSAQNLDCSLGSLSDYMSKCSSDSLLDSSDCSLDCFLDYTR